jgi:hypothetical protein
VFKVGIFDFLDKKAAQQKPVGKVIRHIVCLCYDAPYINSLKPQMQDFIIKAEQERGSIITPTSRITFDSFYDNSDLEKPDMIRQKLEQAYCQVYRQNAMYKLADKTVAREVQYRDGHTLVKYFVLYAGVIFLRVWIKHPYDIGVVNRIEADCILITALRSRV